VKTAIISHAILLACLALWAQETQPARGGGLAERFKQLDRDGDGKLTREEIPQHFDQFDRNKDGVVTLDEVKQFYGGTARAQAGDSRNPATAHPAGPTPKSDSQAFVDLKFTKDYFPGTKDRNGQLMGGVECNYIVAYKGKLYATVSTWKQKGWNRGETTDPQVLVKKTHAAPWEVDTTFGPEYGRAECLRSVTFTTDRAGRKLAEPAPLLLTTTTGLVSKGIGVWSRNDNTGAWIRMAFGQARSAWGTEIRALIDHVDRVTGVHYVFAPATEGVIYRGCYDPDAPGGIAWEPKPEYRRPSTMPVQRVPASCEAGGVLYVSLEMDPKSPGSGGVFRRVDGPQPRWEHVYEWTHAAAEREAQIGHKQDRLVYGLAAVSDPRDPGRETLICVRDLRAQVLGIDLPRTDKAMPELDAQRYFEKEFQSERAKVVRIAANGFTPLTHPDTGEKVHLTGLWVAHPDGADTEKGNSSWYLVRHADGSYAHGRVWTPDDPVPNKGVRGGLRTTRTICLSPFPEDRGRVLYFGGFDSGLSTSPEEFSYTAWIYRATLPLVSKDKP
jgi:hypothetical protein